MLSVLKFDLKSKYFCLIFDPLDFRYAFVISSALQNIWAFDANSTIISECPNEMYDFYKYFKNLFNRN